MNFDFLVPWWTWHLLCEVSLTSDLLTDMDVIHTGRSFILICVAASSPIRASAESSCG